ncbi:aspartyl protease family protein [[Pseudomonas] boreopolis]|uniref:aspartyl protease family protein n=1 Tax=Xanthomonas boreopolis TaxID=86183 RepID=UPI003D9B8CFE
MSSRTIRPVRAGLFAMLVAMTCAAWAIPPADADARARTLLQQAADGDVAALAASAPSLEPRWQSLAQARLAAARLDERHAIALAEDFLRGDGEGCDAALAQGVIADAAFAAGSYARAAEAGRARLALLRRCDGGAAQIEGASTLAGLAGSLAAAPAQRVVAFEPGQARFARDKVGLPRAQVAINGHAQEAVLDTGANLSVVSASTAARLGLRELGQARVGTSSRSSIATRVAVADRLELAGLVLEHAVFLVLEDAQLEMPVPGGYRIDAIVGFPVFRAMQRVRFGHDGVLSAGGEHAGPVAGSPLALAGSDLFVEACVGGIAVPLHLDSGGNGSSLSARFAALHPELVRPLPRSRQRLAGAGGATEQEVAQWKDVEVAVGGRRHRLGSLPVALRDSTDVQARSQGVLGGDMLNAFDSWTLDFRSMRFELGEPLAAPAR